MENIVSGNIGLIHLLVSIVAMITGIVVLISKKGTKRHKQIGYIYVTSMLLVNFTAFMIYRLFGGFGIFHFFAIVSFLTLLAGMYPMLRRKGRNYIFRHFNYMYWSVVGLYCAFCAEVLTRIPFYLSIKTSWKLFSTLTVLSIFIVMVIAIVIFKKYKIKWQTEFE
ncbi:DUF2306 domain-containing protein [Polaribacter sp. HL-MS24]|uniref:DUF2306 domain-containing protein n=1 Tax=Polaribacter sp. HL-MS24 TaxID=3077735 RepID=UPI0029350537|nr:DUF2306 domain-containing protein [Polaribacter sp. HL-MS24]WOC40115.1 DUF2306 domain-containing protein [Polaribacter sp. HL-MS24]